MVPRVLSLLGRCHSSDLHVPLAELLVYSAATDSLYTALYAQLCTDLWRTLYGTFPLESLSTSVKPWKRKWWWPPTSFMGRILVLLLGQMLEAPLRFSGEPLPCSTAQNPALQDKDLRRHFSMGCGAFLGFLFASCIAGSASSCRVPVCVPQGFLADLLADLRREIEVLLPSVANSSSDTHPRSEFFSSNASATLSMVLGSAAPPLTGTAFSRQWMLESLCKFLVNAGATLASPSLGTTLRAEIYACRVLLEALAASSPIASFDGDCSFSEGGRASMGEGVLPIRLRFRVIEVLELWARGWEARPRPRPETSSSQQPRGQRFRRRRY